MTLPGASRPLDAVVFHVLAPGDLRRVRDDHGPTQAGSLVDPGMDGEDGDGSPASLDDAVTAAHSRRVALLHERIAALCGSGAAVSQLAALRDRLRRAEAAWRLAAARGGEAMPADNTSSQHLVACRPRPMAIASAAPLVAGWPTVRVTLARHAAGAASPGARWHGPATVYAARVSPQGVPVYRAAVRLAGTTHERRRSPRYHAIDAASVRLAEARRSLARARRALAGEPSAPAPMLLTPPQHPAMVVASLWRWDGSDRWRLSPLTR